MNDNSVFVNIDGKNFLVSDIHISDDGEVSYEYSSLSEISEVDKQKIHDFVYALIKESIDGANRRENRVEESHPQ